MYLGKFCLPKPDIRLITLNDTVYKIKLYPVKPPVHIRSLVDDQRSFFSNTKNQEDIEKIIIILLTSSERLQPIRTKNLVVYPHQKKWEIADKIRFYRHEKCLSTSPYVYNFYIEQKTWPSKNQVTESNYDEHVPETSDFEDNQSFSILHGINPDLSNEVPEEDHSVSQDFEQSDTKNPEDVNVTYSDTSEVVIMKKQNRKRHNEFLSEEESTKKKYSVSEYLDKNRHEVQEQDLQEQLRLQELATPVNEKPGFNTNESRFQRMISSVKRLMFGSS